MGTLGQQPAAHAFEYECGGDRRHAWGSREGRVGCGSGGPSGLGGETSTCTYHSYVSEGYHTEVGICFCRKTILPLYI